MKLTLEKDELVQLIGNALGYALTEEDVTVSADPFEVRIRSVDLTKLAAPRVRTAPSALAKVEEAQEEVVESAGVLTMAEILDHNSELGGPVAPSQVDEEDLPPLARPLGVLESEEPPPITDDER